MKTWMYLCLVPMLCCISCSNKNQPITSNEAKQNNLNAPAISFPDQKTILLPQAQFDWDVQPDGSKKPKPGPARLLMLTWNKEWQRQVLEDADSRVFHKALCLNTPKGPKLVTLGGTDAMLKLWELKDKTWTFETLWHPKFGGKWDRLRDLEIGNIDDDPAPEMVVATHDQGVIAVLDAQDSTWKVQQVYQEPDTFVHEIEIGDVDNDGHNEFFATPSKPNKAKQSQAGKILMFRYQHGTYVSQTIAEFSSSHVKEILVADLNQDKIKELYAAKEAELAKGGLEAVPLEILRFEPSPKGPWKFTIIAKLPGAIQSRVLLATDLTQTGKPELVFTTMKAGIWRLIPPTQGQDVWKQKLIDKDSSGFEHAANVADVDLDGKPELYVAADDQDEIRQYVWQQDKFIRQTIEPMAKSDLTWNIDACRAIEVP